MRAVVSRRMRPSLLMSTKILFAHKLSDKVKRANHWAIDVV